MGRAEYGRPVRMWWSVGGTVALWLLALAVVWSGRVFFLGTLVGMVVSAVAWVVVLGAVVGLGILSGRRWALVGGVGVTLLLCAATFNWSAVAPRAWFELHRPLYDHAVQSTQTDDSYYGASLPLALRPLSANGRVADQEGVLVFPQWLGIPDDAGGYVWSPDRRPEVDMFGYWCDQPVDLGDGWWMCAM